MTDYLDFISTITELSQIRFNHRHPSLNIKSPTDMGYWNYTYNLIAIAFSKIPFKELVLITSDL
ncbi:MAG: hypothetical protein V7K89_18780 [Nostoc sp.]|uniref:hypothetical protein n=1 Tax=Nostoc sp. TaxID=1180 RepID=UPI002FF5AF76